MLPGNRRLIVSDYAYGLAVVDTATGAVGRLASRAGELLDGIDGLWLAGKHLVGVQNGLRPMRIVQLELDIEGEIASVGTLEAAHPAWTEPLGGALSNGELVYIGNGQWDRFGPGGAPVEGKPAVPTEIRMLDLEPGRH